MQKFGFARQWSCLTIGFPLGWFDCTICLIRWGDLPLIWALWTPYCYRAPSDPRSPKVIKSPHHCSADTSLCSISRHHELAGPLCDDFTPLSWPFFESHRWGEHVHFRDLVISGLHPVTVSCAAGTATRLTLSRAVRVLVSERAAHIPVPEWLRPLMAGFPALEAAFHLQLVLPSHPWRTTEVVATAWDGINPPWVARSSIKTSPNVEALGMACELGNDPSPQHHPFFIENYRLARRNSALILFKYHPDP